MRKALLILLLLFLTYSAAVKNGIDTEYHKQGLEAITSSYSLADNFYTNNLIISDRATPAILTRKGYPDINLLFISVLSYEPLINFFDEDDKVAIILDGDKKRVDLRVIDFEKEEDIYKKTLVIFFPENVY